MSFLTLQKTARGCFHAKSRRQARDKARGDFPLAFQLRYVIAFGSQPWLMVRGHKDTQQMLESGLSPDTSTCRDESTPCATGALNCSSLAQ